MPPTTSTVHYVLVPAVPHLTQPALRNPTTELTLPWGTALLPPGQPRYCNLYSEDNEREVFSLMIKIFYYGTSDCIWAVYSNLGRHLDVFFLIYKVLFIYINGHILMYYLASSDDQYWHRRAPAAS